MRKNSLHKKKKRKFKILLDAAFASVQAFPRLSRKANLAHVVHTYHLSKTSTDEEIYQLATKENRFVVTINFKDFRKMVKRNGPGIIGIESQLSNKEIDNKIADYLTGKNPDDFIGKAIRIKSDT